MILKTIFSCLLTWVTVSGILIIGPIPGFAGDLGKQLVENQCSNSHRLEGKPDSRFNLKAPDLMWAGSKFQIGAC